MGRLLSLNVSRRSANAFLPGWAKSLNDFGDKARNKLGPEDPKTGWNIVEQGIDKSMRDKDWRLSFTAHNPKVGSKPPGYQP
jgi:hypothetical protein